MSCQEFRDWAARNSGTAGIQGFRNSGAILQRIQGLGCQEFKGCAGIQELQEFRSCAVRNSGIHGLGCQEFRGCRNSGVMMQRIQRLGCQDFRDCRNLGIQGLCCKEFRDWVARNSGTAGILGFRDLCCQELKDCRNSGTVQEFRDSRIQGFRNSGAVRNSRIQGLCWQEFQDSGAVQEFRNSGAMQEFRVQGLCRDSGIRGLQEFRNSGIQRLFVQQGVQSCSSLGLHQH